jgi:AcrR family transcriptional regulator
MDEHSNAGRASRPYRLQKRLASMQETRRRITTAAFELHATVGPSRTTISAIAERAGVQRHTVYAHFPDVETLFEACTRHGMEASAMPEPGPWASIDDPDERLRVGLGDLYAWYRENESMLRSVLQDDPMAPAPGTPDPFTLRMAGIVDVLAAGTFPEGPIRFLRRAVVAHAVDFTTWRSLTRTGLSDEQACDLLVKVASRAGDGSLGAAPAG